VFAQWTAPKSSTPSVFGPWIETEVDPGKLIVKTILDDQERQNYPLRTSSSPEKLVSLISQT